MEEKIKIIASDLDRTLFDDQKRISSENRAAVENFKRNGGMFVPATGRALNGIPTEVLDLAGESYIITLNGAEVYALPQKTLQFSQYIPQESLRTLLSLVREEKFLGKVEVESFSGGKGYVSKEYFEKLLHRFSGTPLYGYILSSRIHVPDIFAFTEKEKNISEIALSCSEKHISSALISEIEKIEGLTLIPTTSEYLEIVSSKTSKGEALKRIAEGLGLTSKNVAAVGDGENDIPMLVYAEKSFAMENASKTVKEAAKFGTAGNNESGVASAINALFGRA